MSAVSRRGYPGRRPIVRGRESLPFQRTYFTAAAFALSAAAPLTTVSWFSCAAEPCAGKGTGGALVGACVVGVVVVVEPPFDAAPASAAAPSAADTISETTRRPFFSLLPMS